MDDGQFSESRSKSKLELDELFVTCLNDSKVKVGKLINNFLDSFISTNINYIYFHSCLVSPSKPKKANIYSKFNSLHLLSLTFDLISISKLRGKELKQVFSLISTLSVSLNILKEYHSSIESKKKT